jgi:hypothetical protein
LVNRNFNIIKEKKQNVSNNKNKNNKTNIMAATYRFKTIMVTDEARERFTNLRDSEDIKEFGRVTDKELFDAIMNLVSSEHDIVEYVRKKKQIAKQNKERQKLEALKKELESKLEQTDDTEEAADLDVAAQ